MPPNACPLQGRQMPTPTFYAAGTGGITMLETCVSAAATRRPTTRARRRYIAVRVTLPQQSLTGFFLCSAVHLPSCFSAAKRLPPAGPPVAQTEVLCRRHKRRNNDWNMHQRHRGATAKDQKSSKVHRLVGFLATVQIKPVIFSMIPCTSADLFLSCCGGVADPRAAALAPRSSTCDVE
jgi:hypothetical protein